LLHIVDSRHLSTDNHHRCGQRKTTEKANIAMRILPLAQRQAQTNKSGFGPFGADRARRTAMGHDEQAHQHRIQRKSPAGVCKGRSYAVLDDQAPETCAEADKSRSGPAASTRIHRPLRPCHMPDAGPVNHAASDLFDTNVRPHRPRKHQPASQVTSSLTTPLLPTRMAMTPP